MSQPFIDLTKLEERRFRQSRRAFAQRHNKVSMPWLMFCIGFALGIGLMLIATH